jgi:hypothetical protein
MIPGQPPQDVNQTGQPGQLPGQGQSGPADNTGKIAINPDKAKFVAQVICKEIENSFKENDAIYKLSARCENQYLQKTKYEVAGTTPSFPWYGAADYFVPMTEWIVDAVWSRVNESLFSQEPAMMAQGQDSMSIESQDGVTDFVDQVLREKVKLRENIEFFFKQMIKIPFAVCKYTWVTEYDPVIRKEKVHVFVNQMTGDTQTILPDDPEADMKQMQMHANGYEPAGMQDYWVKQDKPLIDEPQLTYVKFADYVWCPGSKKGKRLYWEGDRCWYTMQELSNYANADIFLKEAVSKVKTAAVSRELEGVDREVAKRSALRECFHYYGRLPFNQANEVDFDSPEAIEQEVHLIVDYKEKELLYFSLWEYSREPWPDRVYIRESYEETEEFEGRSLVMKLYMTQKYLNQFYNQIMNNAMIAMQKVFVKKRSQSGEAEESLTVHPGAVWEEDNPGDIRVLEMGDLKQVSWELETSLMNFAERISNISNFQSGVGTEAGDGKKTATEVTSVIAEGNIGMNRFIQRCHGVLQKICKWTVDYYYERMPTAMERRIRNDDGFIFPSQKNAQLYADKGISQYWEQDDLAGQFDWKWLGTALNSSKAQKIAVANDLMEKYLPQPMVAGSMIATWEILKQGLVARGQDWKKVLPPREAVLQEMQLMNAKTTQVQPGAQTMGPAGEGQAQAATGGMNV